MRTSSRPYMRTVSDTKELIWETSRTSTAMAVHVPLWSSVISRATVLMVDDGELGSGGKGVDGSYGFEVVLAATTTAHISICICLSYRRELTYQHIRYGPGRWRLVARCPEKLQ